LKELAVVVVAAVGGGWLRAVGMIVAFCGFSTFKAAMNTVATSTACGNGVVGQVFEACSGLISIADLRVVQISPV
jgi:hypothetical protein